MTDTPVRETPKSSLNLLYLTDGIATQGRDVFLLAARLGLGAVFVMSGWGKLFDLAKVAASFPARGLPAELGYVAPFVEFFGGLFLMIGFATRYSALVMLAFTIVATFSSHRYWTFTDPAAMAQQSSNFWKNVAIMGGMFATFVAGGGRISVDGVLRHSR